MKCSCGYDNPDDAAYCGLCYNVLKKVPRTTSTPGFGGGGESREKRLAVHEWSLVARYGVGRHTNPELLDGMADGLLQAVAGFYGQGVGLADGVKVQFGWSGLTLKAEGTDLVICEPDFGRDPLQDTVPEVSVTLSVSLLQALTVNIVKAAAVDCTFKDSVMMARGILDKPQLVMHRHKEPEPGDSGWYIGSIDVDEMQRVSEQKDYEFVPSWMLYKRGRGHLLKVMCLPPHYMAIFDGDTVKGVSDPDDNELWPRE